jgi:hypothetical protein
MVGATVQKDHYQRVGNSDESIGLRRKYVSPCPPMRDEKGESIGSAAASLLEPHRTHHARPSLDDEKLMLGRPPAVPAS